MTVVVKVRSIGCASFLICGSAHFFFVSSPSGLAGHSDWSPYLRKSMVCAHVVDVCLLFVDVCVFELM